MGEEERTTDTLLESAAGRGMLRRESDRDLAEFIRESDRRVDVGERQVRVDISRQFEFGTDLEDPVFVLC
jgi:hypothetical protein